MSEFLSDIHTRIVHGGWELTNPVIYYSDYLGRDVVVPAGFFTDLASVPRLLRWLVPVANAKNRPAAIVHDWLCHCDVQQSYGITQAQADRVFREALAVCRVGTVGTWGMWLPVRSYQFIKGVFK